MNKKIMIAPFLAICLSIFNSGTSMAMVLPLPMVQQLQTNWCWAGSTKAIENYYGKTANECDMANYLNLRLYGYYPDNCCNYAQLSLPATHVCNQGNFLLTSERVGNVQEIMSTMYSTPNSSVVPSLTQSAVQTEIYAGRPFEMRWDWQSGGAHALVGFGITGNLVDWMDPWPWNTQHNVSDYSWVNYATNNIFYAGANYNHTWTQTIKPGITPQPPIPDIKANNMDGSISVSYLTPVNVTISLNPGGFASTQADWWVAAYLNGILYYYYYDTSTNPPSWQWTTQQRPTAQGGLASL